MDKIGRKPTSDSEQFIDKSELLTVSVTLNWDDETVTVNSSRNTNVATILYALLLGYNSVYMEAQERLDREEGRMVH